MCIIIFLLCQVRLSSPVYTEKNKQVEQVSSYFSNFPLDCNTLFKQEKQNQQTTMSVNHNRHHSLCTTVMNSDLLIEKLSCTDFSEMFWQVAVVEEFSYTETQVSKF